MPPRQRYHIHDPCAPPAGARATEEHGGSGEGGVCSMLFGFSLLWKLFKAGLLATNAVTILHKQRFLRKCEGYSASLLCVAFIYRNDGIGGACGVHIELNKAQLF